MENQRIRYLQHPPAFVSFAAVGGFEEGQGPLGGRFDHLDNTDRFGQPSWERAEGEMGRQCLNIALKKADLSPSSLSVLYAGDLQNQCVSSSGGLFSFGIPYMGLYGACSTCTEGLMSLALFLSEGGQSKEPILGAAVTTSHNCAAERQFRQPIEYGGQRPPSAQWTATAAGAFVLTSGKGEVRITEVCPGKIVDGEMTDATNMGAAMAPAAADTIRTYMREKGVSASSFDAIVTGDLGAVGSSLLCELLSEDGIDIRANHIDCGLCLYDRQTQDVHSGASGCGCSASVLATKFLPAILKRELNDILFLSTGALMSTSSVQQGEHIFGIAPLIRLQSGA